ncbi:hypothetical protein KCU93_g465, partial [Aureobasidium melanogenum]
MEIVEVYGGDVAALTDGDTKQDEVKLYEKYVEDEEPWVYLCEFDDGLEALIVFCYSNGHEDSTSSEKPDLQRIRVRMNCVFSNWNAFSHMSEYQENIVTTKRSNETTSNP